MLEDGGLRLEANPSNLKWLAIELAKVLRLTQLFCRDGL